MTLLERLEILDLYALKDVGEILRRQAKKRAREPAIFCENRVVNFGTLQTRSQKVAAYLTARRSDSNQRVGFVGRESEAYYEVLFGCALAGSVFVPINWRLTPREVAHILTDAGIDVLFCDAGTLPLVQESLRASEHRAEVVCLREGLTPTDYGSILQRDLTSSLELPEPDPRRTFCIIYTSGTTGLPKGVCLPHEAFFRIREALISNGLTWLDWYPGDRGLVGIPGWVRLFSADG
jgi:acyl-CoA synthetase (AMP-forming)/AMP-acid ligase II